ncbi:MAG: flagellar basal body rod protein FlgC [Planctomycetaceae bacterium]|nr:flagellar basal body rod protein FlgC [Planctomycetaceae bacterium]
MFGALDISTSALVAQRTRMNVIAANMANMNTTHDADGNYSPFRRRIAILAAGDPQNQSKMGVHVREVMLDDAPFRKVHLPNHPNADADGNVNFPNIDSSMEMINALEASRAYEANITAAEATKSMLNAALQLLA